MNRLIRPALVYAATLAVLSCAGVSSAASPPPSTGLGQSWPNVQDVSGTPRFHVYVFERGGLRFVQVNDLGGTVRGAIAYTDDASIVSLPVGVDANRWTTPTEGGSSPVTGAETVYSDGTVNLQVAPQPDGTLRLMALPGDCKNPAECSVPGP